MHNHPHKHVSVTLNQLATMRLMLRLQHLRAIRIGMQQFRAGALNEWQAVGKVLQREDQIQKVDLQLMKAEEEAAQESVAARLHGKSPNVPVNLCLHNDEVTFLETVALHIYGTDAMPGSGQAEQGRILQSIQQEREGIILALKTATEALDTDPVFQPAPKGNMVQ